MTKNEALAMSDEIFVYGEEKSFNPGTPVDIYDEPINRFVADFIGESISLMGLWGKTTLWEFVGKEFGSVPMPECVQMKKVEIVIRPEDLSLTSIEKEN